MKCEIQNFKKRSKRVLETFYVSKRVFGIKIPISMIFIQMKFLKKFLKTLINYVNTY